MKEKIVKVEEKELPKNKKKKIEKYSKNNDLEQSDLFLFICIGVGFISCLLIFLIGVLK